MKEKKVIIAHLGKQHSFRLAEAIKNINLLDKYITTVYLKQKNYTGIVGSLLRGDNLKRVNTRRCTALSDNDVHQFCEVGGLITLLLLRIDRSQKIYRKWNRMTANRFAKKVAKYAIKKNPDAIVMYDTNAPVCFDILQKKAPHIKRILDFSSATGPYMKKIFKEDMERYPEFAESLRKDCEYFWNEETIKRLEKEISLAHHFIVPSKFVQNSIEYHGIESNKIHICPYGVDTKKFIDNHKENKDDKLRCVFVGQVSQRKGIGYLLKAFEKYNKDDVSLTIVGKYDSNNNIIKNYSDKYIFTGLVTHEKVADILSESDIMVFTSLSEGLSLAVMEALGSGIPVICTANSGYEGIIKDEYNGFIIQAGDIEAIREKIDWFLENQEKLPQMRKNARNTAMQYTWDRYNKRIEQIMENILKEG